MRSLKKSIQKNNQILLKFYKKKSFLTFILRNSKKHFYKFVYKNLNKMFLDFFVVNFKEKLFINVNIDLNNYFFIKSKIVNFLKSETFSFEISSVKINNNMLDVYFFEKNLILNINKICVIEQVYLFIYLKIINDNLTAKINLFLIISLFFNLTNMFKIITCQNVYNSPSGI